MNQRNLLNIRFMQKNVKLTSEQRDCDIRECAELAMIDAAVLAVERYKTNQAKSINKEASGLFSSVIKGEFTLWLRGWYFKRAKKEAITRANIENRKIYVIRSGDVTFKTFSTMDVEINKRLKIFGKQVNAKTLTETADYVAVPSDNNKRVIYVKHKPK
jgi:hypothetical protein